MNLDALRAASTRLIMAQDAVQRDDKEGALRHLLGLQAALAEMHEVRRRRRSDHVVATPASSREPTDDPFMSC